MKKFVVIAAVVVAAAALFFVLRTLQSPPTSPQTYASLEEYLADGRFDDRDRVVLIGLDGAVWSFIDSLIAAGDLPTFERLRREGASGPLRSVHCTFTPPAWTAMMTGYRPERHGVYTFGEWVAEEHRFKRVTAADVREPSVWDVASAAGRRVAVTNVPVTFPARPVNGIMVCGFMAPIYYNREPRVIRPRFGPLQGAFDETLDAKSYSDRLGASVNLTATRLQVVLYDTSDDDQRNHDTVAIKVLDVDKREQRDAPKPVITMPLGHHSPWFHIKYRELGTREELQLACNVRVSFGQTRGERGIIHIEPLVRVPTDPLLALTYPEALAGEIEDEFGYYLASLTVEPSFIPRSSAETASFANFFYRYDDWDLFAWVFKGPDNIHHEEGFSPRATAVYKAIDRYLANLIERLDDRTTLILASDHGFAEYDYIVDFNAFLESLDLFVGDDKPDYRASLVSHHQWTVYFNDSLLTTDELAARGIDVPTGSTPRQALRAFLKAKVSEIADSTGRAYPLELIDVPDDAVDPHPEFYLVGTYGDYYVGVQDLGVSGRAVVAPAEGTLRYYHSRDGIYLLWGDKIVAGVDGGVRQIVDIGPTMLYLMGLPMADDFHGAVMDDLIRDDARRRLPRSYLSTYADLRPDFESVPEEIESLEEKLRSLGYIR